MRGYAETRHKAKSWHRERRAVARIKATALGLDIRFNVTTAAYWLMLTVRDAIPRPRDLATAEFATLRLRLLKVAACVIKTASRVRLAFAAACPEAELFRLPSALWCPRHKRRGHAPSPFSPSSAFSISSGRAHNTER